MIQFILNSQTIECHEPPGLPLLDFIRYHQRMTGTKIGCREGDCGACTILVGELVHEQVIYKTMTSCLMPLGNAAGKHIVTIEGINLPGRLNLIQQAMADNGATQCGFCTPGFVMSLTGFCLSHINTEKETAIAWIDGNICRCTGYKSIEKAAADIAGRLNQEDDPVSFAVQNEIVPDYFMGIKDKLATLNKASTNTPAVNLPATIVAGGTDLYVQKHDELAGRGHQFVFDSPAMNFIRQEGNTCIIGPSVTVQDLRNSAIITNAIPEFTRFTKLVSSTPIRNMATIAGNFVNASPIGDMTILFLALDATLELSHGEARRMLPLRQFYKGYKELNKEPDEIITAIAFALPGKSTFFNFEKVSKRTHLDIASVNTAISLAINDNVIHKAGLSAGGVGPVPMYLHNTSAFLAGKKINDDMLAGAIDIMKTEISPISDARGSAAYKTLLLAQLIKAHFIQLHEKR